MTDTVATTLDDAVVEAAIRAHVDLDRAARALRVSPRSLRRHPIAARLRAR